MSAPRPLIPFAARLARARPLVVLVGVMAIAMIVMWLQHQRGPTAPARRDAAGGEPGAGLHAHSRVDSRMQPRGSIRGTVRDDTGAPVQGGAVCTEVASLQLAEEDTLDPICVVTDEHGRYELASLIAAEYVVHATARGLRPGMYHPVQGAEVVAFALGAGEVRSGVDLVLRRGGVEITGRVLDITGGPVAHAHVRASPRRRGGFGAVVDASAQGEFSLWVDPGQVWLLGSADGYAPNRVLGRAPGVVDILLTPESSLAGIVVDAATNEPVEGARVDVNSVVWNGNYGGHDTTDERGRFRVERLTPGRFITTAATGHGYGRAEGSTLIGLGVHVDGVVVKLAPAWRVSGKIVIASTSELCAEGVVELIDAARERSIFLQHDSNGVYEADGVPPGTYSVGVSCRGFAPGNAAAPIVVEDRDVLGQIWQVEGGAQIRGRVLARSGEPVEGARISDTYIGGDAADRVVINVDTSKPDGQYRLRGLKHGVHRITVETSRGVAPREGITIDVTDGATLERDLIVDAGGTVVGTVVDDTGRPIPGLDILAIASDGSWSFERGTVTSDESGRFRFEELRPGDYRITASRGWGDVLRRPGTTDDAMQGEPTTVRSAQVSTVRLVVEGQRGAIRGTVVDAAGGPVPDAFVAASRESDAVGAGGSKTASTRDDWWGSRTQPVVTGTDGSFELSRLPAGMYSLRAYRKGGGEAIAEHVATGSVTRLQIRATGSLEGIARRTSGPPPRELRVSVHDASTGFNRQESFYMTGGHFAVRDVPGGRFELTFVAEGSQKTMMVDLQDGQSRTGLEVTLDPLVTVTGRLVALSSLRPIGGMYVFAASARGASEVVLDLDLAEVSDAAGRFLLRDVPTGLVAIRGQPKDAAASEYSSFSVVRHVAGTGTIDLGDLQLVKRRARPGEAIGALGLHFVEQRADTPEDERVHQISWIDPVGPAARTALQVGDVITSCDGIDVTAANSMRWDTLVRAPPATKLVLGTRRGVQVTLVLGAP
jgi:hypothetical protein